MSKKVLKMLQKARTQMLLDHPFFAQVVLETKTLIDSSVPTMATDGHVILVNPEFTETLTNKEIQGVLAHEAMHILGMHHLRMQFRDHTKWNHATDYAINDLLTKEGFSLPKGGLLDEKYATKAAEHVYNILPDSDNQNNPSFGEVCAAGSLSGQKITSQDEIKVEEQRIQELAAKAATTAKMQGKLPGGIERMVDELVNNKVPWHELLRRYMDKPSKDDYSWTTPNRRFVHQGIYMPGLSGNNNMGEVVVAVDTSGSIGDRELSTFLAQIRSIVSDATPSKVTVLYFDTKVSSIQEFIDPSEFDITLNPTGGGGTDFDPIFNWVKENGVRPEVIVVLTDMYASVSEPSEFDTVWAALPDSSSHTPDFGTRIDIEWGVAA